MQRLLATTAMRRVSTREISRRMGRAETTVKAYLYDPSQAPKRPTDSRQERQLWSLAGHARTSICKPLLGSRCDGTRPAFPTARFVRKDSELVGSLVAALLAEQNTAEPVAGLLGFVSLGSERGTGHRLASGTDFSSRSTIGADYGHQPPRSGGDAGAAWAWYRVSLARRDNRGAAPG
jgi:hypothetical protein